MKKLTNKYLTTVEERYVINQRNLVNTLNEIIEKIEKLEHEITEIKSDVPSLDCDILLHNLEILSQWNKKYKDESNIEWEYPNLPNVSFDWYDKMNRITEAKLCLKQTRQQPQENNGDMIQKLILLKDSMDSDNPYDRTYQKELGEIIDTYSKQSQEEKFSEDDMISFASYVYRMNDVQLTYGELLQNFKEQTK